VTQKIIYENWRKRLSVKIKLWDNSEEYCPFPGAA